MGRAYNLGSVNSGGDHGILEDARMHTLRRRGAVLRVTSCPVNAMSTLRQSGQIKSGTNPGRNPYVR